MVYRNAGRCQCYPAGTEKVLSTSETEAVSMSSLGANCCSCISSLIPKLAGSRCVRVILSLSLSLSPPPLTLSLSLSLSLSCYP